MFTTGDDDHDMFYQKVSQNRCVRLEYGGTAFSESIIYIETVRSLMSEETRSSKKVRIRGDVNHPIILHEKVLFGKRKNVWKTKQNKDLFREPLFCLLLIS